jgi:putative transposase
LAGVSPADWHDGRVGALLLKSSRRFWPFITKLWADKGYAGKRVGNATSIDVEIVSGPKNQVGFIVQKRRWVVERTI